MNVLKKGDTIKCANEKDLLITMKGLETAGIETDFLYEKDGEKGLWLEVIRVHRSKNES